jgi:serine/threonine protein phosphatase PrpC
MLHLDIKPANIFITDDNKAVMIDFGAAREVLSKEGNFIRPMYTPGFAAPEMYRRDSSMGPWTDIYAIGACIYACMQGYPPNDAPQRWRKTAWSLSLRAARRVFRQPDRGGRVVHGARPAVAPAVGVCAAEGAQPRRRAPLHQAQRGEKMRLQLDTLVSDTKKNVQKVMPPASARAQMPTRKSGASPVRNEVFSVFQISRRGGREKNEDRMGYCYTRESGLFVLADGMGGHPEGEVAAQIALQTISALFQRQAKPQLEDVQEFLSSALLAAHHQILRYATEKGMLDTPRTTLVAAVVQAGAASWIHCGDSRLYMVRGGELLTRTRDHSYLELRNAPPPGLDRINRNVLFTCLGSPTKPIYDSTGPVHLEQGDRILLCSDGLWGTLSDEDIATQLSQQTVSNAVPDLVEAALRKAGESSDNVTVVALEWETPDTFDSTQGVSTDSISDDTNCAPCASPATTPCMPRARC